LVEENLIKKFMTSIKCKTCGQHYEVNDVEILGNQEDLWLLSVSCAVCHTQCLVAAVIKEERVINAITDLTESELDKFRKMGKLTADEMLDMHNFLKSFDGDFYRIFNSQVEHLPREV
jgi:MinD superfamily P-loop ATPase